MSPFEVYEFNSFTSLDLLRIPSNTFVSEIATSKTDLVKTLHKEVKKSIEKQNFKVVSGINIGRKENIFQPGDWVWIHFRKERFSSQRKTKLHPRGDDPCQVLERINNNAYKIDFLGDFLVHSTFNVANLSLFDVGDDFSGSSTTSFEEGKILRIARG